MSFWLTVFAIIFTLSPFAIAASAAYEKAKRDDPSMTPLKVAGGAVWVLAKVAVVLFALSFAVHNCSGIDGSGDWIPSRYD